MEEYLNDIQTTSQSLLGIKAGLDDEFVGIIMLAGLTDEYNPLVMTLEHSGMTISTESVQAALLKESLRKSSTVNTAEDEIATALMSKSKKGVICHLCKKKGHYKWQCQRRKTEDKTEDKNGTSSNKKKDNKEAAMVLTCPPEDSSRASFDLWHRRLGHLSGALM
ncbi:Retrovirus-related Pol polyprotein, partial [Operophtera brumata]